MKLTDFDYTYPEELVAQKPLGKRDQSKMMVIDRATKTFEHKGVKDLPDFLQKGDLLVLNNSKVLPVRLYGKRESGAKVEMVLLKRIDPATETWTAVVSKKKRLMIGEEINFSDKLFAEIVEKRDEEVEVALSKHCHSCEGRNPESPRSKIQDQRSKVDPRSKIQDEELNTVLHEIGYPPLPPYIKRNSDSYSEEDVTRYQTVYAKETGSAAAPTAGFHITEKILKEVKDKGVEVATVTLHVGLDTFSPVRVDEIENHKMHGEEFTVPEETLQKIAETKKSGGKVIAVGTTSVRALESYYSNVIPDPHVILSETKDPDNVTQNTGSFANAQDDNETKETNLFIYPGYKFKIVDAIVTNFHQPKSTLIMMISAFAGKDFIFKMYKEAISKKCRLFSFGDCMFIT